MPLRTGLLKERVALVTGAASGIGLAIAHAFAREGANVVLLDVDRERGAKAAWSVTGMSARAVFIPTDVTGQEACDAAVAETLQTFGRLDILCNSAGVILRASVLETTPEAWDHIMNVNVKAVFLLARAALPSMIASGGGAIINIASGWGLVGGERAAAYCASKGAVVQLTRAMAIDFGKNNVRVNCICPGDTDTPMLRSEARQLGETDAEFLSGAAKRPLGRIGRPEDIAEAAVYLACERASFVTGSVLVVDGGGLAG